MKRFIRLLVWLYPGCWRRRYRTEFEALLEDIRSGWQDLFNVIRGALEMRMTIGKLGISAAIFGIAGGLVAAALSFTIQNKYRKPFSLCRMRRGGQRL